MAVASSRREMLAKVPQRAPRSPAVASIKWGNPKGMPVSNGRTVGMTSHPHARYVQGYTRATRAGTKGSKAARWRKSQKPGLSTEWRLQRDSMKTESIVIADQQAAVNTFRGLGHTARHTAGVYCT